MKKKLLLTAIATMMVATLLTGCGNTAQTDIDSTETVENDVSKTNSQETDKPHEHNYVEAITKEATCTEAGEKTFTCECGDSYTEEITATGHVFNEYVYNEDATYTLDGTETATCVCGETDKRTKEGSKLEYTYTDMDKTMYAKSSVNVRSLPSTDGEKLGGLSKVQEVHVTGQCNETGWYRIDYNGSTGYVSSSYLVNDKPAEPTPEPEEPTQPSEPEECPVTLNTIIDCGDYFYMWVCRHTQDDMGQPGLEVGTQYAIDKWGTNWSMKGCNDHIEWNGYIICQEVWSYTGQ